MKRLLERRLALWVCGLLLSSRAASARPNPTGVRISEPAFVVTPANSFGLASCLASSSLTGGTKPAAPQGVPLYDQDVKFGLNQAGNPIAILLQFTSAKPITVFNFNGNGLPSQSFYEPTGAVGVVIGGINPPQQDPKGTALVVGAHAAGELAGAAAYPADFGIFATLLGSGAPTPANGVATTQLVQGTGFSASLVPSIFFGQDHFVLEVPLPPPSAAQGITASSLQFSSTGQASLTQLEGIPLEVVPSSYEAGAAGGASPVGLNSSAAPIQQDSVGSAWVSGFGEGLASGATALANVFSGGLSTTPLPLYALPDDTPGLSVDAANAGSSGGAGSSFDVSDQGTLETSGQGSSIAQFTLTHQQAVQQGVSVTPQQAQYNLQHAQGAIGGATLILTHQQAIDQGILVTPDQAAYDAQHAGGSISSPTSFLTHQQAVALGISVTPDQAAYNAQHAGGSISSPTSFLTHQQAVALGISVTPDQAAYNARHAGGSISSPTSFLTHQQAVALGISVTPDQAAYNAQHAGGSISSPTSFLTHQQAVAQGISVTPQQAAYNAQHAQGAFVGGVVSSSSTVVARLSASLDSTELSVNTQARSEGLVR